MNIINTIKRTLKSKSGQSYPMTITIILVLILLIVVTSEYFRLMIIAQGVRDTLQDAVISTVTENFADVYHGTREGYSGGYRPVADDFEESINYGDIYEKLENVLGLEYNNGVYVKISNDGEQQLSLYNLDVDIKNAPIRGASNPEDSFEVDGYITLEVPVNFGGELLPPMRVRIKTSGAYTPVF